MELTPMKPYFTKGKIGKGGRVLGVYSCRLVTLIVSAPMIVHDSPKNPYKISYGGWTFGCLGINYWVSFL